MKVLFVVLCISAMLLFPVRAQAETGNSICQLGQKVLLMSNEQADEFFGNHLKGTRMAGKGIVIHIRQGGENKRAVVTVDCGNDVVVNVATGEVVSVKIGQQVDFEGTGVSYGKRRYIYSQNIYMIFEFDQGLLK